VVQPTSRPIARVAMQHNPRPLRGSETLALVRCAASRGSACISGHGEEANLPALNIRCERMSQRERVHMWWRCHDSVSRRRTCI
jgi:hypothetical protein